MCRRRYVLSVTTNQQYTNIACTCAETKTGRSADRSSRDLGSGGKWHASACRLSIKGYSDLPPASLERPDPSKTTMDYNTGSGQGSIIWNKLAEQLDSIVSRYSTCKWTIRHVLFSSCLPLTKTRSCPESLLLKGRLI